nr:hypothetical protein BdHM001_35780 [Bdellovibrio sp. HM001]
MEDTVAKTNAEAVKRILFEKVLETPVPRTVNPKATLRDYVPKKFTSFADDFVIMYLDKIEREFNVSTHGMKSKTISDILSYLESAKVRAMKYGNRPMKKKVWG